MKKPLTLAASIIIASSPLAAEFGVGAGTERALYFPIKATSSVFIEPYIGFWKQENTSIQFNSGYSTRLLGVGVFASLSKTQALESYIGARLHRQKLRQTFTDFESSRLDTGLSPTIGASYWLSPNVSVSGEFSYTYLRGKAKPNEDSTSKSISQSTTSQVVLRYYFSQ
jgi:hypothetical protein